MHINGGPKIQIMYQFVSLTQVQNSHHIIVDAFVLILLFLPVKLWKHKKKQWNINGRQEGVESSSYHIFFSAVFGVQEDEILKIPHICNIHSIIVLFALGYTYLTKMDNMNFLYSFLYFYYTFDRQPNKKYEVHIHQLTITYHRQRTI